MARKRRKAKQYSKQNFSRGGGKTTLHKRKPLRDPAVADNMAFIRARGKNSPANRKAAEEAYWKRPWTEYDQVRQIGEDEIERQRHNA